MVRVRKSIEDTPIGVIAAKSNEQPHLSLGHYSRQHPPKGFAIHLSPDPEPDAIVTQITRLEADGQYEYILHVANYGDTTINAEVWHV